MDRKAVVGRAVLLALFASGFSGLTFEVVWTRWLALLFGSTTFAVSSVLAAYMAGLGLGAWALGRLADRLARPVRAYAALEAGIGLLALAMPLAISATEPLYRAAWSRLSGSFYALSLLRFALLFVLLLLPTLLMGATLPTLSKIASPKGGKGLTVGLLYAVNTAGAVLGTVLAGWVLIPKLGAQLSNALAAGLNLAIAASIALLSRSWKPNAAAPNPLPEEEGGAPSMRRAVMLALAVSGAAAMLYEVAWTRMLVLVLGPSTYAFSTMLATVLAGLALGAYLVNRFMDRIERPAVLLGLLQGGAAAMAAAGSGFYPLMPMAYVIVAKLAGGAAGLAVANKVAMSVALMFPSTLLLGGSFPLAARICSGAGGTRGRDVGRLYAFNTAGAVLGSFAAGFLLVPSIGMQHTVAVGIAANVACALLLFFWGEPLSRAVRATAALCLPVLGLSALAQKPWDPAIVNSGIYRRAAEHSDLGLGNLSAFLSSKVLYFREGYDATVSVTASQEARGPLLALRIDGKVDASDTGDMSTQLLAGLVGMALHPQPREAMLVGLASGTSAGAVLSDPRLQSLDIVEMERAMVSASRFFEHVNGRPLADPRARLVLADARNHWLLTDRSYDLISSEPSNPWMSGPSHLFTREAFQSARARLRPGGVMVQWLHFYSMSELHVRAILRTFAEVFPHVALFRVNTMPDLLAVGSDRPLDLSPASIGARLAQPRLAQAFRRAGVRDAYDLLAQLVLVEDEIRRYAEGAPLNRDDDSVIEYGAPASMGLSDDGLPDRMVARADLAGRGYGPVELTRLALRHEALRLAAPAQRAEAALKSLGASREAEALAALREGRAVQPGPSFAEQAAAGLDALAKGRCEQATGPLRAALAMVEDNVVRDSLGLALACGPHPEQALELLGSLSPEQCMPANCLAAGKALRALKRPEQGLAYLQSAIKRFEIDGPELPLELARTLEAVGRQAEAFPWYAEAHDQMRSEAANLARLGERALSAGHTERAEELCQKALASSPISLRAAHCALAAACRLRDDATLDRVAESAAASFPLEDTIQTFRLARLEARGDARLEAARAEGLRAGGEALLAKAAAAAKNPCGLVEKRDPGTPVAPAR